MFFLSFAYFIVEGFAGFSIGKYIFHLRIAGKRTWQNVIIRSFVKSIPPLSLVDFIFVFKKLKYTQRYSDHILDLSVARLKSGSEKSGILLHTQDKPRIFSGLVLFFLPLITFILYDMAIAQSQVSILPPTPNSEFNYAPSFEFLSQIFSNNLYVSYIYYIFGGLFLCFPMAMQLLFQAFTSGKLISDVLSSHPQFFLFGILPHLILESFGFAIFIAIGLIITETLLDLYYHYRQGKSLDSNRSFLSTRFVRILKLSLIGLLVLLMSTLIEVYITPQILLAFYFH